MVSILFLPSQRYGRPTSFVPEHQYSIYLYSTSPLPYPCGVLIPFETQSKNATQRDLPTALLTSSRPRTMSNKNVVESSNWCSLSAPHTIQITINLTIPLTNIWSNAHMFRHPFEDGQVVTNSVKSETSILLNWKKLFNGQLDDSSNMTPTRKSK